MTGLKRWRTAAGLGLAAALVAGGAQAQTKVNIGISGWTGFAPLTLAKEAGIFAKNGLDVTIKKIPQKDRHLAIASGDIQCAATTVETWIVWDAAGVKPPSRLFQLDKSYGRRRHGRRATPPRRGQGSQGQDGRGLGAGHLARISRSPGSSRRTACRVKRRDRGQHGARSRGAAPSSQAPATSTPPMTYEPFLSAWCASRPDAGKIIATTLDYPMVMDTFGCTPAFVAANDAARRCRASPRATSRRST